MKRQIRFGMFESNSSSSHVMFMTSRKIYDEYSNGKYLYIGGTYGWKPIAPERDKPYTIEEVKELIKNNYEYYKEINEDDLDEDEIKEEWNDVIWEAEFISEESIENQNYEEFWDSYTTPNGEEVVAFGYYGWD